MSVEREPPRRESTRPLRPLPSVALPLLRNERSAARQRRLLLALLASAALALLAGGAALLLFRQPEGAPPESEQPLASTTEGSEEQAEADAGSSAALPTAPDAAADTPPSTGRYERSLGRARSFSHALRNAGMTVEEAESIAVALTGQIDFRHVHPEDLIIIERDQQGQLMRFEYRASATLRYEAVRVGSTFEGREIELLIETVPVARGGVIQTTLGDALEGLGLGRALTGLFADVFSGKVNFSADTRAGDTFRVLLDEEHLEGKFLRHGTVYALEYHGDRTGLLRAFWHESLRTEGDFFDAEGRALHGGWLRTPLRYDYVSSGFGMRFHPLLKRKLLHSGIDYRASTGTPVHAAAAGVVRMAGSYGPNGNLIAIAHPHGYETFYAHLSRFATGIRAGTRVKQRQVIAYVGSTGRSTGPHLHFALKKHGRFVDPATQLNGPGLPLPASELSDYKRRVRALTDRLDEIALEQPAAVTPTPEPTEPLDLGEEEL